MGQENNKKKTYTKNTLPVRLSPRQTPLRTAQTPHYTPQVPATTPSPTLDLLYGATHILLIIQPDFAKRISKHLQYLGLRFVLKNTSSSGARRAPVEWSDLLMFGFGRLGLPVSLSDSPPLRRRIEAFAKCTLPVDKANIASFVWFCSAGPLMTKRPYRYSMSSCMSGCWCLICDKAPWCFYHSKDAHGASVWMQILTQLVL